MKQLPTIRWAAALLLAVGVVFAGEEWKSGIQWPEPKVVTPGTNGGPPSDAIILFDGSDLTKWDGGDQWIVENGYAQANKTDIKTKDKFGDCQLHLEFATPADVTGEGQGRGNSGVYLAGKYEVQILDSYANKTYFDGQCAAIYKQMPPMVNACRKPGEWQSYDILYTAPRFHRDGLLERPGTLTVCHNGVCVLKHFELQGSTAYDHVPFYEPHEQRMPIQLQNHGNPVRFRNIWVRELTPMAPKK